MFFDVYLDNSMKSTECVNCGSQEGVTQGVKVDINKYLRTCDIEEMRSFPETANRGEGVRGLVERVGCMSGVGGKGVGWRNVDKSIVCLSRYCIWAKE